MGVRAGWGRPGRAVVGVNPLPPPGFAAEGGPGGLFAAQKALCTADGAKSLLLPLLHLRGSGAGKGPVCRAPALGVHSYSLSRSLSCCPHPSQSLEPSSQLPKRAMSGVQEAREWALPEMGWALRHCFSDLRNPKEGAFKG